MPQVQTSHPCPSAGCERLVPFDMLACKVHWYELPMTLRRAIAGTWREGDLEAWAGWRRLAVGILDRSVENR